MVAHHKDPTLKSRDIDRYLECREEDMELLSLSEHTIIHHTGAIRSEETRHKIAEKATGRVDTPETREKRSKSHIGLVQSPETIEKRASKLRGKTTKLRGQH